MGIRESLLNTITSVGNSDFVRIVTSAGASSKATVRNLFKGFESNLSAKSSLSDSDYIRVVGSDNEAYKQSVSAVKTAMGIDALSSDLSVIYGTSYIRMLTASDDLRTLAAGTYRISGVHPIGMPIGVSGLNYGWVTITNRAASSYRYYDLNVGQGDFGKYKRIFGWSNGSSTSDAIAWNDEMSASDTLQSATLASGLTGWVRYIKVGKMVMVGLVINKTNAISANTAVATGLPAPIGTYTTGVFYTVGLPSNVGLRVTDTGNLVVDTAVASGSTTFRCSFSYIANA